MTTTKEPSKAEWITFELAKDLYNLEPSDFKPSCVDWTNYMVRIR